MARTDDFASVASQYERFATIGAQGISPTYEALALNIARSQEMLEFLAALPSERRQPNLFLAAIRKAAGLPRDGRKLGAMVRTNADRIREIMLSRTTQTNEPARCAVLLPVLARLPQPLALIEVGASAGLCLLPDRYGYDFGRRLIDGPSSPPLPRPVFPCSARVPMHRRVAAPSTPSKSRTGVRTPREDLASATLGGNTLPSTIVTSVESRPSARSRWRISAAGTLSLNHCRA